jgi:hypothetical protein
VSAKNLIKVLLIVFFSFCCVYNSFALEFLPQPKKISLNYDKKIVVDSSATLELPTDFKNKFSVAISEFNKTLSSLPEGTGKLIITVKTSRDISNNSIPKHTFEKLKKPEAYWITIKDKNIQIVGSDLMGSLHGLTTLEYFLKKNVGKIAEGEILDWPDLKIRAFHLVLKNGLRFEEAKEFLAKLRYGHYNTLVLMIVNWVKLDSMKELVKNKNAWSKEQFREFVNYARGLGIEVVPQIELLTHQEKLLKDKYPDLMYNISTYDPRKEEVYKIIFPILDELASLSKAKAIHIGHDEAQRAASKKMLLKETEMLPAALFLKDILRLHDYLTNKGIEVWMWGDMLIGKEEFPQMFQKHLHGNADYIAILPKIPKDIVICDWHYFDKQKDFPSSKLFAELGHKVLGTTWYEEETIKNFSRYIANLPKNGYGMIATLWFSIENKDWGRLEEIAGESAEAFWNAK